MRQVPWPGTYPLHHDGPGAQRPARGRQANRAAVDKVGSCQAKPRAQMLDGRRNRVQHRVVDSTTQANRVVWEAASQKHVREYGDLLAQAVHEAIDTPRWAI